jgi:hypothetical protein
MVCSHCQQVGHTYRTCPTITEEEKKAKAEEIKKKKEEIAQRREHRRQREAERQRIQRTFQQRQQLPNSKYNVSNPMDYEVVIYWTFSKPEYGDNYKARVFSYCGPHSSVSITCKNELHRLIMIPFIEVTVPGRVDAINSFRLNQEGNAPYQTVFDMKMEEYDGTEIIIDKDYTPPKTEMDLWKECALKSKFLLDQIYMLTGGIDKDGNVSKEEFENIGPMLDMIQDISIPSTCTEIDKEIAGVPSGLTNIT